MPWQNRVHCQIAGVIALVLFFAACGGHSTPPVAMSMSPTISSGPADTSVPLRQSGTFTVTATSASPLTYQWQKNGVPITGATSAFYTTPPANEDFAFSWIISQATGFQYSRQTVSAAQLPTVAAQLASQGRVITAISFDGDGNVMLFSYSWQGDTAVYDAKVTFADLDTYATAAQELSAEGYIITAVGGGNDDSQGTPLFGIVLVGTRVQGDSLPRPMQIVSGQNLVTLIDQGFATVEHIGNSASSAHENFIMQK